MKKIRVFAPATVANVACGFDIFGLAVERPGDIVELEEKAEPGLVIKEITGDEGRLPKEVEKNTAGIAIKMFLEHLGMSEKGFSISLHKDMPLGSGLGSSAASAVAGVYAANEILGRPMAVKDLLPFAMEGERVACGSAHADNVAPSLLGGFVVIRSYEPLDIFPIKAPEDLWVVIIHPQVEVNTKDARLILEKEITLGNLIKQTGNVAGLVIGMMEGNYELIGRSLEDVIIEPVRSILLPQFKEVKAAAKSAGALGVSISGSGPSMFALCKGKEIAEQVAAAMQAEFSSAEIDSERFVSKINPDGPMVVSE